LIAGKLKNVVDIMKKMSSKNITSINGVTLMINPRFRLALRISIDDFLYITTL